MGSRLFRLLRQAQQPGKNKSKWLLRQVYPPFVGRAQQPGKNKSKWLLRQAQQPGKHIETGSLSLSKRPWFVWEKNPNHQFPLSYYLKIYYFLSGLNINFNRNIRCV